MGFPRAMARIEVRGRGGEGGNTGRTHLADRLNSFEQGDDEGDVGGDVLARGARGLVRARVKATEPNAPHIPAVVLGHGGALAGRV